MNLLDERRADRYRGSRRAGRIGRPRSASGLRWRPAGGAWALAVVLVAGLVAGGLLGWPLASRDRERPSPPAATTAPAGGGEACRAVLAEANDGMALGVRMKRALADHARITEQLAHGVITPARAVALSRQTAASGTATTAKFDAALADYLAGVDACKGR
jgi:hypothetical protein